MKKICTNEENIQILISLLKEHNIKKAILSPGTSNISFVASLQSDDYFEVYSCVDERSAAYMAVGLAEESGEPVILSCTGATASRNYIPALTEAFYNKVPIIAITASQPLGRVGQNVPQVLDRSRPLNDIVKKSITLDIVHSDEDRWKCNLNVNDVLLECKRNGGGPVHINMVTVYSNEFIEEELPKQRVINRYCDNEELPKINAKQVGIFIGNHNVFTDNQVKEIEKFCENYNAVVLCDHTSNYNGKYKILGNLVCNQNNSNLSHMDLMIDLGNVSGAAMSLRAKEIWRVNPDGEIRDTHKKITKIFSMQEEVFFKEYNKMVSVTNSNTEYYNAFSAEDNRLRKKIEEVELPFSNPWIAMNTIGKIEEDSIVHLAILNTLRSWNYFTTDKKIKFYSNTGGFGIDGIVSTAIGSSLSTDRITYCFIGDLAFFYDLNSIGNNNIKKNLRIMLINNGCGTEFHNYNNRAVPIYQKYDLKSDYIAADGHNGNKSDKLVKHLAEDLGFEYITADNKKDFLKNIDYFTDSKQTKPIIFEVFTNYEDESNAIKQMNNLEFNAKNVAKKILGEKGIKFVKKIIKK